MRPLLAQTPGRAGARPLRRGESLLLTLGIPVLLLVFFSLVDVLPHRRRDDPVDFLAPGVLALAVMSTAMVSLAIATGFERQYGVLKRLGVDAARPARAARGQDARHPRRRGRAGRGARRRGAAARLATRRRRRSPPSAAVVLGTVAFAGLGLLHGRHAARRGRPWPPPTASTSCCSCSAAW